jgi:hypothetical protein
MSIANTIQYNTMFIANIRLQRRVMRSKWHYLSNKSQNYVFSMASPFTIYSKNKIYRKIIAISPILKRYLYTRERYLFMLERYLLNKKTLTL